jgi:hypothetical protein
MYGHQRDVTAGVPAAHAGRGVQELRRAQELLCVRTRFHE